MLSHSHQKKIQVKKTTFYFDYSENGIEFYKRASLKTTKIHHPKIII